jgi:hypothetical protein
MADSISRRVEKTMVQDTGVRREDGVWCLLFAVWYWDLSWIGLVVWRLGAEILIKIIIFYYDYGEILWKGTTEISLFQLLMLFPMIKMIWYAKWEKYGPFYSTDTPPNSQLPSNHTRSFAPFNCDVFVQMGLHLPIIKCKKTAKRQTDSSISNEFTNHFPFSHFFYLGFSVFLIVKSYP